MYTYTHQDTGINAITFEPSFRYQQWMYGPFAGFKYSFYPISSLPHHASNARVTRFKNAARRAVV